MASPKLPNSVDRSVDVDVSSRRLLLGGLGGLAMSAVACKSSLVMSTVATKHGAEHDDAHSVAELQETCKGLTKPTTPAEALQALKDGNSRFASRKPLIRSMVDVETVWSEISVGQAPFASVLGCADSRLSPEFIFDQFFGDIFVVREAGNLAGSATNLGSLEYAQAVLKSKVLVVMGHSMCGAVDAAHQKKTVGGNIQAVIDAIKPGIASATTLDDAITLNVKAVMQQVRTGSPLLAAAEKAGDLQIVGAVYDIKTSVVTFL